MKNIKENTFYLSLTKAVDTFPMTLDNSIASNPKDLLLMSKLSNPERKVIAQKMEQIFQSLNINCPTNEQTPYLLALSSNLAIHYCREKQTENESTYLDEMDQYYKGILQNVSLGNSKKAEWCAMVGKVYTYMRANKAAQACYKAAIKFEQDEAQTTKKINYRSLYQYYSKLIKAHIKEALHYQQQNYLLEANEIKISLEHEEYTLALKAGKEAIAILKNSMFVDHIHYYQGLTYGLLLKYYSSHDLIKESMDSSMKSVIAYLNALYVTKSSQNQKLYLNSLLDFQKKFIKIKDHLKDTHSFKKDIISVNNLLIEINTLSSLHDDPIKLHDYAGKLVRRMSSNIECSIWQKSGKKTEGKNTNLKGYSY